MLNINEHSTLFVKGFAQDKNFDVLVSPSDCHGEFLAIITDMIISDYLKITSATLKDGKWIIKCSDGKNLTLDPEPDAPREMSYGKLVTNFTSDDLLGDYYDIVFQNEYDNVIKNISKGDKSYKLVGYIKGHEVVTSHLVKFWIDTNGKKHGMTLSGSHYIF